MAHKAKRFFQKLYISMIRSRQRQAAEVLASQLIHGNRDFARHSHADLVRAILSKKEVKLHEISR